MASEGERYVFEAEWFDKVACILKKFYLYYFPSDNTVELYDLNTRKTFLRRTRCDGVESKDFFIGGIVNIFSRNIKLTNYADAVTRQKLSSVLMKTCAIIKPEDVEKMGKIMVNITNHNIHIGNVKMVRLSEDDVLDFYKGKDVADLPMITKVLSSGPVVAMELLGDNVVTRWLEIVGSDGPRNWKSNYGSENRDDASRDLNYFFPNIKSLKSRFKTTATFNNCTCCIIKPHAVQARQIGHIVDDIQNSDFDITALQQFIVEPQFCEEFFEIYKGILPEYKAMIAQLQSGPCIAMEIKHKERLSPVVQEFRKLCGPMDPEIGKKIRPDSLRAKYGKNKVQNAVHCSDLEEDGVLEVEYFFKLLN